MQDHPPAPRDTPGIPHDAVELAALDGKHELQAAEIANSHATLLQTAAGPEGRAGTAIFFGPGLRHAPGNTMTCRISTGHVVGRMTADPVGSERVRRHPHHRD